jgi:hypothetical protein
LSSGASFQADPRANALADWKFEQVGKQRLLLLRGSPEIAAHVLAGLPETRQVELGSQHGPYWTHRLVLDGDLTAGESNFLRLLRRVLVLSVRDGIDGGLALDYYNRPDHGPQGGLEYTDTARLMRTIKYKFDPQEDRNTAGRELCRSLAAVVQTHLWLRSATCVLPVPGHDQAPAQPSVSVRIGQAVARLTQLPCVEVKTRREYRRSVKEMSADELATLTDEFVVEHDLRDQTVLIVDDMYHTGSTMSGLAQAARQAGAGTVLGLVALRNWTR